MHSRLEFLQVARPVMQSAGKTNAAARHANVRIAIAAHLRQKPASSRDFGLFLEGAAQAKAASSDLLSQHLRRFPANYRRCALSGRAKRGVRQSAGLAFQVN